MMSMKVGHPPHGARASASSAGGGSTGGGDDHRFGSISRPIDVPAGSGTGEDMVHHFSSRTGTGSGTVAAGGGGGTAHDLTARSVGYPVRGGTGTSYPPRIGDDDVELGHTEAYSYNAASFSLGGASQGNYVVSDFGYALQRPGIRYEAAYRQSPPPGYGPRNSGSHHMGASSVRLSGLHGGAPSIGHGLGHRSSFTSYTQAPDDVPVVRGHERGGRALSMDQTQTAPLHYYMGTGPIPGSAGGQLPGVGGRFGPQSMRYPSTSNQASSTSSSAATAGPPAYTPLARGGFLAPSSGFRSETGPQGSVPWVRSERGFEHSSQPVLGRARAQSTSPLFGRYGSLCILCYPP